MKDERKTKALLIQELAELRLRIADLEKSEAEHRRTEDALQECEDNYHQLFTHAPTGIYEVDFVNGRFAQANSLICEYTGYSKEELLTMNPLDILTEESQRIFFSRLEKLGRGEDVSANTEYRIKNKDGSARWVQVNNKFIRKSGVIIGALVIAHDITERKQAEKNLQEAYATLDEKVNLRTHQLHLTNERLKNEIKERKRVELNLRKSKDKLSLLSNRLINAQEDERKRIAIELHDDLGQSLVGLKFQLSSLHKKLGGNQKEIKQEIAQASKSINLMTENVRRLSRDLRPSVLEHLEFFEAVEWLFEDFSKKYGVKITQSLKAPEFSFYQEQEITIFRIIQEALANIGKHAEATQVSIELTPEGRSAVFSIKDNGKGFSPLDVKGKNLMESGLGLTAMAERAQMAGGTFNIESTAGKGTLITFSVPIRRKRNKSTLVLE
ncbi:MAG: PAS domain S-box protein [Deltaproteobacteria bacterium]|nr:PAS domain S-box protein [Deltaproteobacteria bacterium]